MDELVAWLRVQLDNDERVARALQARGYGGIYPDGHSPEGDAFLERFDEARVLAEVDAKRRLLAPHATGDFPHDPDDGPGDYSWTERCDGCGQETPCQTLRLLALPYADQPGYREEWRP